MSREEIINNRLQTLTDDVRELKVQVALLQASYAKLKILSEVFEMVLDSNYLNFELI